MDLCNVSDTTMCIRMNHLGTKERWCLIGSTNHMDVQSWLRTPVGRGNADKTKKKLINKGKFTSPQIKFIYLILSQTSYSQQIHRSTYILLEKQVKFNIPVRQVLLLFYTERNTILLLFLYGGNRPPEWSLAQDGNKVLTHLSSFPTSACWESPRISGRLITKSCCRHSGATLISCMILAVRSCSGGHDL